MERMRARDIRQRLKGRCEPEVMRCMEALAEQQAVVQQQLQFMAKQLDMMADILTKVVQVGENMKNTVEAMKSINPDGQDDPGAD